MRYQNPLASQRRTVFAIGAIAALAATTAVPAQASATLPTVATAEVASSLAVGDVVFIRVTARPFIKVADTTRSWTNHVGIVVDQSGTEPLIAESTFPVSRTTPLSRFVGRSENGRVEVSRLNEPLSLAEQSALINAANARLGIVYDTGFNLHSRRQFCSRFVHEVLAEATGAQVGEAETFEKLLASNPQVDLNFWRLWYFGYIPWKRETLTPASLLQSAAMHPVFDGYVRRVERAYRVQA